MGVSEDIELDGTMSEIEEIVECSVKIVPVENRITDGKIQAKANALVKLVYLCASNEESQDTNAGAKKKYEFADKKLPINLTLDIGADVDCDNCVMTYYPTEIRASAQNNSFGEKKIAELDFSYDVLAVCADNSEVSYVRDAFSTEYESKIETRQVLPLGLYKIYSVNFTKDSVIPKERYNLGSLSKIVSVSADAKTRESQLKDGVLSIVGDSDVKIIYLDTSGEIKSVDLSDPFKIDLSVGNLSDEYTYVISLGTDDFKTRIDENNISLLYEITADVMLYEKDRGTAVESVSLDYSSPIDNSKFSPVTLYYPVVAESVYDIAKKYSTPVSNVVSANKIEGGTVKGPVYVPSGIRNNSHKKVI